MYAFDVDGTVEVSSGPVPVAALRDLHAAGHIVGLCGNWGLFIQRVPDWARFIAFLGPVLIEKAAFLAQLKTYAMADRYVMVGNEDPDKAQAVGAGWEFVREADFVVPYPGG